MLNRSSFIFRLLCYNLVISINIKSMFKLLKILGLILIILIIGGILYLGYLGFVPGVSTIFGSDKPRDLGVSWTKDDYNRTLTQTKVEVLTEEMPSGQELTPENTIVLAGSHLVKASFTESEVTAMINNNQNNWKYFPVSDVQIKLASDGSAQMSGMLHLSRLAGYAAATGASQGAIKAVMDKFNLLPKIVPFYVSLTPSVSNNVASLNFSKVELGRVGIPNDLITKYDGGINSFFTQQINAFPGLTTKAADLKGGKLNFDGTLSDSVKTYK